MVNNGSALNEDGVRIVLGFLQLHFLGTGLESVDDPELAWAGVTQLDFLFGGQPIVIILLQKENGVEEVIFYKGIKLHRLPLEFRIGLPSFILIVMIVIVSVSVQQIIQKAEVIGVHLIPMAGVFQSFLKNVNHLFQNIVI